MGTLPRLLEAGSFYHTIPLQRMAETISVYLSLVFFFLALFFPRFFSTHTPKNFVGVLLEKKYSLSETKKLMGGFIVLELMFLGGG